MQSVQTNSTRVHQQEGIDEWLRENDSDLADVDRYADLGQFGGSDGREQFSELLKAGEYSHAVYWDISPRRATTSVGFPYWMSPPVER
jgi:hypothetical protein